MPHYLTTSSDQGTWQQFAFSPPLNVQAGDTCEIEGDTLHLVRAGMRIDSRPLPPTGITFVPEAFSASQQLSSVLFFKVKPMPGVSATLDSVTKSESGQITFSFSDGFSIQYLDFEAMKSAVESLDTNTDLSKKLLILRTLRMSPDGVNLESQVGSLVAVDGRAAQPIVFSLVR